MPKLLFMALLALLILIACSDPSPTAVVPSTETPTPRQPQRPPPPLFRRQTRVALRRPPLRQRSRGRNLRTYGAESPSRPRPAARPTTRTNTAIRRQWNPASSRPKAASTVPTPGPGLRQHQGNRHRTHRRPLRGPRQRPLRRQCSNSFRVRIRHPEPHPGIPKC